MIIEKTSTGEHPAGNWYSQIKMENRVEIQPGKHSMERNGDKESSKGKVTRDTGKEFEKKKTSKGCSSAGSELGRRVQDRDNCKRLNVAYKLPKMMGTKRFSKVLRNIPNQNG